MSTYSFHKSKQLEDLHVHTTNSAQKPTVDINRKLLQTLINTWETRWSFVCNAAKLQTFAMALIYKQKRSRNNVKPALSPRTGNFIIFSF